MIETRATVRVALGTVFGDERPSLVTRLPGTTDGDRARRVLDGRTWRELSVNDVDGIRGALLFLAPEAFRAYLPGFVFAAVFSGRYGQDHAHHVCHCLCPPRPRDREMAAHYATRGSTIASAQRRVIVAILEHVNASLQEYPRRYWFDGMLRSLLARMESDAVVSGHSAGDDEPWQRLAELRDRVRATFPAGSPPAATDVVSEARSGAGTDRRGAYSLFGGESWEAAPMGKLMYERAAIHVLLPAAFAYYLPAFLHGALDPTDFGTEISDSVEFSLEKIIERRTTSERDSTRWRALAPGQRRTAGEVLEELARRTGDMRTANVARAWLEQADEP